MPVARSAPSRSTTTNAVPPCNLWIFTAPIVAHEHDGLRIRLNAKSLRTWRTSRSHRVAHSSRGRERMGATDDHISLQDAADELGVHYMTAYRYVRTGRLEAEKAGAVWQV